MPAAVFQGLFIASVSLLFIAMAFFIWAIIEPYILKIEYVRMFHRKEYAPFERLSKDSSSSSVQKNPDLRIAFFSDLHGRGCRIKPNKLCDALVSSAPDIIVFGGDICQRGKSIEPGLNYLRYIANRASQLGIPCFAVRGNHDVLINSADFDSHGFHLLVNETVIVKSKQSKDYLIIGMDDSGRKPRIYPTLPALPEDIPPKHRIAVVHNPDYIYTVGKNDFLSMLSGHLHGGQIYLPFKLEYRLLRGDRLPMEGVNRGFFERNGIRGYISRGCGCVLFPLRLFSKPEVSIVDFDDDSEEENGG